MVILIRCLLLIKLIDGHYRRMRVLRPTGLTNLRLMTSRSILALGLGQAIILDLSSILSSKLVTSVWVEATRSTKAPIVFLSSHSLKKNVILVVAVVSFK